MDPGLRRDDEMGDGASHVADNNLSPQELAKNFPPHCRLIAAHRAAGDAPCATVKEQLRPSALLPALPAAEAAVVAMQTSNAAATISIVNLMASLPLRRQVFQARMAAR